MHNAFAWKQMGIDAKDAGNYIFAIKALTQSIKLNPHDSYTYCCRGGAHSKLNKNRKAIKDFNKSIKLNPDDALAYYYRGFA